VNIILTEKEYLDLNDS